MANRARNTGQARRRHYIKEWREHFGYSQGRVADALDWQQSKLSRIENNTSAITLDDVYELADYYGRSAWDLMNVNPLREQEVIDAMDLFKGADADQKRQIADYTRFITGAGKRAS